MIAGWVVIVFWIVGADRPGSLLCVCVCVVAWRHVGVFFNSLCDNSCMSLELRLNRDVQNGPLLPYLSCLSVCPLCDNVAYPMLAYLHPQTEWLSV